MMMFVVVLVAILAAYFIMKSERYTLNDSDTFQYTYSETPDGTNPFAYMSQLPTVGYIGPDPDDPRILATKVALNTKLGKTVDYVRTDSSFIKGAIHTVTYVFISGDTFPNGFKVISTIDMTAPTMPIVKDVSVGSGTIEIIPTPPKTANPDVNPDLVRIVQNYIQEKMGMCAEYVSTNGVEQKGSVYSGEFLFVNTSGYAYGFAVQADVDMSGKAPNVVRFQTQPQSIEASVQPFTGDTYSDFKKYDTMLIAPQSIKLKTL
jgi:hypothetical protein